MTETPRNNPPLKNTHPCQQWRFRTILANTFLGMYHWPNGQQSRESSARLCATCLHGAATLELAHRRWRPT